MTLDQGCPDRSTTDAASVVQQLGELRFWGRDLGA